MIVVDTSALFVIAANEPERPAFNELLKASQNTICSAVTYVETVMVLTGRSSQIARSRVDDLLETLAIHVVAVDHDAAGQAVEAFVRYGKGRHPAALNFGDCFSYALAKTFDAPLLFKGDDFTRTDIVPAWRP